jgi:hypothetical protein
VEYWDEAWRSILVDGEPVLRPSVVRHGYGFIPYVIGYSGLGYPDKENQPERLAVGLLRYLYELLTAESRAFTVSEYIMKHAVVPPLFVELEEGRPKPTIEMRLGQINYVRPGQIPQPVKLVSESVVALFNQHRGQVHELLHESRAPRSVMGMREPGVGSGYQQSLITGRAQLRFEATKDSVGRMLSSAFSKTLALAERVVPGNLTLWARTPVDQFDVELQRDRIKGHYVNYVELEPVAEEENIRRIQTMLSLVQGGLISRDTGRRKYLSNVDPDEEEVKLAAEALRGSPRFRQLLEERLVQEAEAALGGEGGTRKKPGEAGVPEGREGRPEQAQVYGVPPEPAPPGSPEEAALVLRQMGGVPPGPG